MRVCGWVGEALGKNVFSLLRARVGVGVVGIDDKVYCQCTLKPIMTSTVILSQYAKPLFSIAHTTYMYQLEKTSRYIDGVRGPREKDWRAVKPSEN